MLSTPKFQYIILLVAIALTTWGFQYFFQPQPQGTLISQFPTSTQNIALVPLDSRPPCSTLVAHNGRTAGINILLPPPASTDYYTQPANRSEIRQWLQDILPQTDAAIISVDQLLYGSLLASREKPASLEQIHELLDFLTELHQQNPQKPLYLFSILPRMHPPANIENWQDRKNLLEWSRVTDQLALAQEENQEPAKIDQLLQQQQELEQLIPAEQLTLYQDIYRNNNYLNSQLAQMTKKGIIQQLVLGQDDGEPFSLPNLELRKLTQYIQQQQLPPSQVSISHGADELALNILASIVVAQSGTSPTFYLDYNAPNTSEQILPYMAVPLSTSIEEKLNLSGAQAVATPQAADIIFFVSWGAPETLGQRQASAKRIKNYLAQGKEVALVDLSQHFVAHEALLPILLAEAVPVESLIAYSGWNTASNSLGTALAQSEIYHTALRTKDQSQQNSICYSNIINLNNRLLEDYYYLKDAIDIVNSNLKKAGYTNVYDLDLEHNYQWSQSMLTQIMNQRLTDFAAHTSVSQPFVLNLPPGPQKFQIRQLQGDYSFPWPRTFEIRLETTLEFYQIN